ncbi:MAG: hypothetical protein M1834_006726 [Cirrosporium novae-zelandiae]|nr:MAG: hypothetical protein M1834_006726 [Cirrosporium novae-zelandiae]
MNIKSIASRGFQLRGYATVLPSKGVWNKRKPDSGPTLEHFLLRQQAIDLWRDVLRATNKITDPSHKTEMRQYVREEYEAHRHVIDPAHIRYLISVGRTDFKTLKSYIDATWPDSKKS